MAPDTTYNTSRPRVAILGHHGIPSNYGGFETFAEETGKGLVERGFDVIGYCRSNYFTKRPATYAGIKLVYVPTIVNKYLDTFIHTFLSVIHLLVTNTAEVALVVNVGNAPFVWLLKLFGKKTIFCVDGLDWERKKWGRIARWYLRTCSRLVPYVAHEVVTDAMSVYEFYKRERRTDSVYIPYGTAVADKPADTEILSELGLTNKQYFVYVARFEPENNPLEVVRAYVRSQSNFPLVMIGDNRYNPEYVRQIKAAGNGNVIFLGYVFGTRYKELVNGSLGYVRAAEVGGCSPATIEAIGRRTCVIANDKPENREVVGTAGVYYDITNFDTLTEHFKHLTANPLQAVKLGELAGERARAVFSWERIVVAYERLIYKVMALDTMAQPAPAPLTLSTTYSEQFAERVL